MSVEKIQFSASAAIFGSTSLDALASSATWVAGRASLVIDNTTNLYVDAWLSGRFKANNTAPTAGQIQMWVGGLLDDTNYPDVFDGTDSAKTITSTDIRNSILKLAATVITDATANRVYELSPISVAQLFGGIMPHKWWVFITHNMVQALNATASAGGQCWFKGINYTIA